jgi:hypothetical protein
MWIGDVCWSARASASGPPAASSTVWAGGRQNYAGKAAHFHFIFNQQNRCFPGSKGLRRLLIMMNIRALFLLFFFDYLRQINGKLCPAFRFALHQNGSAALVV